MPKDAASPITAQPVPDLSKPRPLIVKFEDSVSLPYVDHLERFFQENKAKFAGWEEVAKLLGKASFRRLFPEMTLDDLKHFLTAPTLKDDRFDRPKLQQFFVLDTPAGTPLRPIIDALGTWKQVV
jgi:hypothetical protein